MSSDRECGAISAEPDSEFARCDRARTHAPPHTGVIEGERHQFTRVMDPLPPTEAEQDTNAWSQLLPPTGTLVRVFGVDGRFYFGGKHATLERVLFVDGKVEAIRLRNDTEIALVPWSRVDEIEWTVDS